jgi:hypothetical protein
VGGGEDFAAFAELLEVGDEETEEIMFGFIAGGAIGDTTGHVGRIGQVTGTGFLDDDKIFLHGTARDLRPSGAKIITKTAETSLATYGESEIESGPSSNRIGNVYLINPICSKADFPYTNPVKVRRQSGVVSSRFEFRSASGCALGVLAFPERKTKIAAGSAEKDGRIRNTKLL